MITFEEARQIAFDKRGERYDERDNFSVKDWGWETPERWIIEYSCLARDSAPVLSVDKQTGEYFEDQSVAGYPFPDKSPVRPNPYA